jgi:U2 small nuclear ribonucleoprotein A'
MNGILGQQHYRLYTISRMPKLKVLDFIKVTRAEKSAAERLVQSAAGATLEMDVQSETRRAASAATQTFTPGEGQMEEDRSFATTSFTPEQKEMIRNMLSEATSVKEVEDIENSVRRGILPKMGRKGLEGVSAN